MMRSSANRAEISSIIVKNARKKHVRLVHLASEFQTIVVKNARTLLSPNPDTNTVNNAQSISLIAKNAHPPKPVQNAKQTSP
jgi:hypothetical protein